MSFNTGDKRGPKPADYVASVLCGVVDRFLDETNLVVTSLTACAILYTRSAGVAYFAVGATACAFSVKLVKRVIRQPRPHLINRKGKLKKSYGMPSTHSATITHFAVYIALACLYLPIHPSLPDSKWTRIVPPLVAIPWASAVVYSRIWLGHHTWRQCLAGGAYGAVFSLVWFKLWTSGVNVLGRAVETRVHEMLGL